MGRANRVLYIRITYMHMHAANDAIFSIINVERLFRYFLKVLCNFDKKSENAHALT